MHRTSQPTSTEQLPTIPQAIPVHFARAVDLISRVCGVAGSMTFLEDLQLEIRKAEIDRAVANHDTPRIFDWLLTTFSYQGVSDQAARTYIEQNGSADWSAVAAGLRDTPACPRLRSYWHFDACRYDKISFTCSEPEHIATCPVPRPVLRNGRLNQTAYSFFLFVRDIADRDLVGWIDERLSEHAYSSPGHSEPLQERLIGPLRNVYGVSDKILAMTLSGLLLGASQNRPLWFETGKTMIAIDSLVHNFLHRTGILHGCKAEHRYGVGCYAAGGCADIIRTAASMIDASNFNRQFPKNFPRFVQHAIWRYCAADGLNICNGNRIDDRQPCQISYCQIGTKCQKKQLKTP